MSDSGIEQLFLNACTRRGVGLLIRRIYCFKSDWQIDFEAQGRAFAIASDSRDGFVFLEIRGSDYIPFDQGQSQPIHIEDREACERAAALLSHALRDPDFKGRGYPII